MYGQTFNDVKQKVDYKEILQHTDQFDLWSWFLGFRISPRFKFCNPLRSDAHPNVWCDTSWTGKNVVVLYDWADRFFHGMSIFDAIMYRESIEFYDACLYILNNYHKGQLPTKTYKNKTKTDFHFYLDYIPWTVNNRISYIYEDKLFWEPYGITESNLREDRVASCRQVMFNSRNNPGQLNYINTKPSYAIHVNNHVKIYNPHHKVKWLSTCTEEDIGGIDSLENQDNLIITKSYKDWRVLKNQGYNTIWLQNEGCKIPFDKLIKFQQYKTKYILFDNDRAGQKASQELADYANQFDGSYIPVHYDEHMPKDSADIMKQHGSDVLNNELLNLGIK